MDVVRRQITGEQWPEVILKELDKLKVPFGRIIKQKGIQSKISYEDISSEVLISINRQIEKSKMTYEYNEGEVSFFTIDKDGIKVRVHSMRAYLRRCGLNRILKEYEKHKPEAYNVLNLDDHTELKGLRPKSNPIDRIEILDLMKSNLSYLDYRIVYLSYFEDKSSQEVAEIIRTEGIAQISADNVRQRKSRAFAFLRKLLKDN